MTQTLLRKIISVVTSVAQYKSLLSVSILVIRLRTSDATLKVGSDPRFMI